MSSSVVCTMNLGKGNEHSEIIMWFLKNRQLLRF